MCMTPDEAGFELASTRKTRRIGPRNSSSSKAMGRPPKSEHITVLACIGVDAAPVPRFVLYSGATVQTSWFNLRERDIPQLAQATETGWSNSYMMKLWMEQAFDPFTKDRVPAGKHRLLLLDGHHSHIKVDFLDACWDRNITCLIFPPHMTSILQPLDVDFFNQLKMAYHRQYDAHILGSASNSVSKGLFWAWHQRAWRDTATSRQIRGAWRKTGLWPLRREMMGAEEEERTPEPQEPRNILPPTPTTTRIRRSNNSAIRRGVMDPEAAYLKLEKVADGFEAQAIMLEKELAAVRGAQEADKLARGRQGAVRNTAGQLYDPTYQEAHTTELAERKERERQAREKKKGKGRATRGCNAQNLVEVEHIDVTIPGPSLS